MSWLLVIAGVVLIHDCSKDRWACIAGAVAIVAGAVIFCLQRGLLGAL